MSETKKPQSYIAQVPIKTLDENGHVVVIQPGQLVPKAVSEQELVELEGMKAVAPVGQDPQAAPDAEAKPAGRGTAKNKEEK